MPHEQLLEVGWWPSMPLKLQSAASMIVLWLFHTWNLQGQISPTDFYHGLEQITCSNGLLVVPVSINLFCSLGLSLMFSKDHLAQWMLMVCQWPHIKMTKRARHSHDPTGIEGTSQGGLAIACCACPQPGINLSTRWETSLPEKQ